MQTELHDFSTKLIFCHAPQIHAPTRPILFSQDAGSKFWGSLALTSLHVKLDLRLTSKPRHLGWIKQKITTSAINAFEASMSTNQVKTMSDMSSSINFHHSFGEL